MAEERKGVLLRFPLHLLARVDQEAGALNRTEFLLALITEGLDRRDLEVPATHMLAGAALTPPREPAPYPADFETSGADTSEDGGPVRGSGGPDIGEDSSISPAPEEPEGLDVGSSDFDASGADVPDGGPGGASSGRPVGPADPGEPGDPDTGSPEPLVVDW